MLHIWKVRDIPFGERRVLKNSSRKLGELPPHSFSHLSRIEVPYARDPGYCLPFGGPIKFMNDNFHISFFILLKIRNNVHGLVHSSFNQSADPVESVH